jgi:hypothetical protein
MKRFETITLSSTAWESLENLMNYFESHQLGIGSDVFGDILTAGLVRFRHRLKILGSAVETFKALLEEFFRYEGTNRLFPLFSSTDPLEGYNETKQIEVNLPDEVWKIFDDIKPFTGRKSDDFFLCETPAILLGWYMYFGLWRFKELLAEIGHPASAVAKIIEEICLPI